MSRTKVSPFPWNFTPIQPHMRVRAISVMITLPLFCIEFQRSISIQKIKALTKSSDAGNFEFIVHVKNEYDYRFTSDSRDELFEHIKACYFHVMNSNLPVYMVPGKVKEYETSKKDVKAGLEKLPADSYQQRNEDIYEPLKPTAPDSPLTIDDDDLPSQPGNHRASFAKNGDMDVSLSDFTIKKVIGRGSFGKVFLVQKKNSDEVFAMKSLRKDVIIEYD